jgi:hypothetical protein
LRRSVRCSRLEKLQIIL